MSSRRRSRVEKPVPESRRARLLSQAAGHTLQSHAVGALPLINGILKRLSLRDCLEDLLPEEDRRVVVPASTGLLVLLKNVLLSREPLYGVADWSVLQAPDLLGLTTRQIHGFNDDRMGRCLDRLFDADCGAVALRVAAAAVREFQVSLDELHNDSTTVTFHGAYVDAKEEQLVRGRLTPAITWGHNKDHRPDLKQVLYILTVTADGAVPVFKTDFVVAPVHLQSASRIVAFLCVYFLALLVESLLERELRLAMKASDVKSLPLYPEGRPCRQPTAPRVFDAFANIQRHSLKRDGQAPTILVTQLSPLQDTILKLLRHAPARYGH